MSNTENEDLPVPIQLVKDIFQYLACYVHALNAK